MAQVLLENVYKSFPPRKGENVTTQQQLPPGREGADSINVLRRINLTIADGEFMVLVGPSGCGKSTLLRLIAGLEVMTGGNISVGDRLINDLPPKERDIAMVFQNYALYPHMTVYDNIAFGLRRRFGDAGGDKITTWREDIFVGMTRKLPKGLRYVSEKERAVDERVRSVAQLLQIETLLNRLPKQLSGGQRQRVALGRAIARNPQVFLMDEPLSNLDAKLRAETRAQIVKLQRQLGTTTIYVTHDQTEAMTMGDRIAIMSEGKIQQVAAPLELYNYPANRFVAEFIGSPPMNFIPVEFHAPLLITHSDFRFTLPDVWASALQKYDGQTLILGIRPEHLILGVPATKNLPVKVDLVENLGNDTFLSVRIADPDLTNKNGQALQVRVPPDRIINIGEQLWLSLVPDKLHFFDPETELAIFPK
ncbi:ABC transporter ATP-binding protein [Anabaena cylindrica FACHB-243]|uniref:Carbohydrate ABC transporter ATP-binding protein, CUT1 family n=1 Tax=Anabaena cylindrica (strain ATCC 27899 / PCC 7122) TaxID=272123 RepID=K9Z9N0_ANACC|nr:MULTISPECIES: ABC transporter ATP-binding protein [Anabaena]AFZ55903.1 carbohydrate ABC transporter ATP-binding protein, CUT1 family [Anabaena cylindrica PCC 7122]MBD2421326.1 ABC transporter ATP-binding protein [Anabaena cylindrica FACHB-243]MBY5280896.1 ABC transporter ATP-binding protein [Anabaena sp. CCAP 1446/1C]MBY5310020.1 ABC transporter ATP-binding protein [Anabaena sp. CCAP 1446/1C]BAY01670.1 ABC transporter-like protein [Anabaena cylindrica PCC 7122]